jgi:hypothetical protein
MNKLIIFAILIVCLALNEPIHGKKVRREKIKDCSSVRTAIKLNIDVVEPKDCYSEDLCLGKENSQEITDALLHVLNSNEEQIIEALQDLLIIEFMYADISYEEWASNIRENKFDYEGYKELRKLVTKYQVCKKICHVWFMLRKTLRDNVNKAVIRVEGDTMYVEGDTIIISEAHEDYAKILEDNPNIKNIVITAKFLIADEDIRAPGINIDVNCKVFVIPRYTEWDVTKGE